VMDYNNLEAMAPQINVIDTSMGAMLDWRSVELLVVQGWKVLGRQDV
jgi:hypothetical protein